MDTVESVSAYFADSGEWSDNAMRDGVRYLRQVGLRSPGYFHHGERAKAKMSVASRKVDLGDPIGAGRFSLFPLRRSRKTSDAACAIATFTRTPTYPVFEVSCPRS